MHRTVDCFFSSWFLCRSVFLTNEHITDRNYIIFIFCCMQNSGDSYPTLTFLIATTILKWETGCNGIEEEKSRHHEHHNRRPTIIWHFLCFNPCFNRTMHIYYYFFFFLRFKYSSSLFTCTFCTCIIWCWCFFSVICMRFYVCICVCPVNLKQYFHCDRQRSDNTTEKNERKERGKKIEPRGTNRFMCSMHTSSERTNRRETHRKWKLFANNFCEKRDGVTQSFGHSHVYSFISSLLSVFRLAWSCSLCHAFVAAFTCTVARPKCNLCKC